MSVADELQKLNDLRQSGVLTEAEFLEEKKKLLHGPPPPPPPPPPDPVTRAVNSLTANENTYLMLMHLSQLSGYLIPFAGFVAPILMWQLRKNDSPAIDRHGKIITNWILSEVIYLVAGFVLSIIVIGIPLIIAVVVAGILFPILGGLKANNGETWSYPCSIQFIR